MKVYDISGKPDTPYAEGYDACARDLYEMTTNMLLKKGPMAYVDLGTLRYLAALLPLRGKRRTIDRRDSDGQ